MLQVEDLKVNYGHIKAVKGISFYLKKGEIVSILGANGAGKTSTLFGLGGIVKREGSVFFKEENIPSSASVKSAKMGLILCPENRRVFPELLVEENLRMGSFARGEFKERLAFVYELFSKLKERRTQTAGSLSGGEQQMLAVGRSLMSDPELLMLDEPSLGLAPVIVDELFRVLVKLKDKMTILLVEQNALKALKISDRAYVLQNGNIVHSGTSAELLADESVKKAYLGM
ncbi:MAG: ABC transporter ATP-binding protein [Spirochaetales bacterium]|nr:ABC transporter ATP-binding protein [Spirochaetales bacterium]